jgi:hypothetical protein
MGKSGGAACGRDGREQGLVLRFLVLLLLLLPEA